jgi:hypothetical protein
MFTRRNSKVENAAPGSEPVKAKGPSRHLRIGLWVLSTFTTVAALVAISAMVIGRENADMMVMLPLVLFWSITVCVGFAIRSALINVVRTMKRTRAERPDPALERLARMAQREQKHAMAHPHLARTLSHA